jgi:hypothetical protein
MTAFVAMRRAPGPSSESLQRTNPRGVKRGCLPARYGDLIGAKTAAKRAEVPLE